MSNTMARLKKRRVFYISSVIVAAILVSLVYSTITVNRSNELKPPWLQSHDDDVNALVMPDNIISPHAAVEPEVKAEADGTPGEPTRSGNMVALSTSPTIDDHSLSSETSKIRKRVPSTFLPEFKSPCWQDAGSQLTCLPYFYLIGTVKCGTTEVWRKLNLHPEVISVPEEPHWWGPRRNGWTDLTVHAQEVLEIRRITGESDDSSIDWYLNWFRKFGVGEIESESSSSQRRRIFGDGSTTTSYAIGTAWSETGRNVDGPPCTNADLLHAVQPDAKIIMVIRDPVEQARAWYSFIHPRENEDAFHMYVQASIACFRQCLDAGHDDRYCAYSFHCGRPWFQGINVGLYYIYLKDWIDAFSRAGVLVLRLEDWNAYEMDAYKRILQFLDLRSLTPEEERIILGTRLLQSEKTMRADTRQILSEFYSPFNKKLAELLEDDRFDYSS